MKLFAKTLVLLALALSCTGRGWTARELAVIFQHECDHLDGILYTDRADSVFVTNI